jgi:hypothetical protein
MARNLAAAAMVATMGATAWAQEVTFTGEPEVAYTMAGPVEWAPKGFGPEIGLRAGYIKPRDADDGTWFGGVQVRVPLGEVLTLEGSIEFHTSEFADGDIEVVQYPVQATLLVNLLPSAPVCWPASGGTTRRPTFPGAWAGSRATRRTSSAPTSASGRSLRSAE